MSAQVDECIAKSYGYLQRPIFIITGVTPALVCIERGIYHGFLYIKL